ncbi:MAG: hypothetical protein AB7I04_13365 [Pseudomonadales bacterium]
MESLQIHTQHLDSHFSRGCGHERVKPQDRSSPEPEIAKQLHQINMLQTGLIFYVFVFAMLIVAVAQSA